MDLKIYKRKKINIIANNINITLEDIIVYCHDVKSLGSLCIIRIHIEELRVATMNEDFSREKPSSSQHMTYRKATVRNLSLAVYSEYSKLVNPISFEDIRFSERMYIIKPCAMTIFHTMRHKTTENEPVHSLKLEIPNLVLSLNELQIQFISSLTEMISNTKHFSIYQESRPNNRVKENPQA